MVSIRISIVNDTATPLMESVLEALAAAASTRLTLGATAPYAGYVEFGTRRMGAQPYLRPAIDAFTSDMISAYAMGILSGNVLVALETVGMDMENLARSLVPVNSGFLQSTIYHGVS